ncbi:MAG: redoxin domain-containing protein [Chitinophagaceae bacterium]
MRCITCIIALFVSTMVAAQTKKLATKPGTKPANSQNNLAVKKNAGGYEFEINVTPFKNTWVYLGCYYGKYKNLVDSAFVDANSRGVFRGKEKLPGGIYFFVTPQKSILFEFLVDDMQRMKIVADTARPDDVVITGSKENELFTQYTKFLAAKVPVMNQLQMAMRSAKSAADSNAIREQMIQANNDMNKYRDNIGKQYPESMLAQFFNCVRRPESPITTLKTRDDSVAAYRYVKDHFWDGVNFFDERLLRTPFFDPKLEEYFKYYVSPEADSIIPEVNYILLSARSNYKMFKYLLGRFTDKYVNPEVMGQDKVFIFLFNNFFSKGDTAWLSVKQREFIFNRAYSLMANQIGEYAAEMQLVDTAGKPQSLYGVNAPFTFVAFWDHTCGHCKEQIPQLDSFYRARWSKLGVKIYAVNTNDKMHAAPDELKPAMKEWIDFIKTKQLSGWYHVHQTKQQRDTEQKNQQANYRQLYDVYQTPTFYLLDEQKRIIGKKLTLQQFDDLISAKLKQQGK